MSAPIDNLNNRPSDSLGNSPNDGPARAGKKIPGRPLKIGIGGPEVPARPRSSNRSARA